MEAVESEQLVSAVVGVLLEEEPVASLAAVAAVVGVSEVVDVAFESVDEVDEEFDGVGDVAAGEAEVAAVVDDEYCCRESPLRQKLELE